MITIFFKAPHNVLSYKLRNDSPAIPYFMIDEATGQIYLKKTLTGDGTEKYEVSSL